MLAGAQHAHLMYDQRKHKEKTEKTETSTSLKRDMTCLI